MFNKIQLTLIYSTLQCDYLCSNGFVSTVNKQKYQKNTWRVWKCVCSIGNVCTPLEMCVLHLEMCVLHLRTALLSVQEIHDT
jgi:hypothetical protein